MVFDFMFVFRMLLFVICCAVFALGVAFEVMNCALVLKNIIRRTTCSLVIVVPILLMGLGLGFVWDYAPDSILSAVRGILSQLGWRAAVFVLLLEVVLWAVNNIVLKRNCHDGTRV